MVVAATRPALAGAPHKQKVGYTYLHSMDDGFSRQSYTELLEDGEAVTTIEFFHRARVFFAAHGVTWITRLATDNGSNYTASALRRSTCTFISPRYLVSAPDGRGSGRSAGYGFVALPSMVRGCCRPVESTR